MLLSQSNPVLRGCGHLAYNGSLAISISFAALYLRRRSLNPYGGGLLDANPAGLRCFSVSWDPPNTNAPGTLRHLLTDKTNKTQYICDNRRSLKNLN